MWNLFGGSKPAYFSNILEQEGKPQSAIYSNRGEHGFIKLVLCVCIYVIYIYMFYIYMLYICFICFIYIHDIYVFIIRLYTHVNAGF